MSKDIGKYQLTKERSILMFTMLKKHLSPRKAMSDKALADELGITSQALANIRAGRANAGASIQLSVLIITGWNYLEFRENMRLHGAMSADNKNY